MEEKVTQALSILKSYSCLEPKTVNSELEKQQLQSALKLIINLSDDQNFGICADNSTQAINTLKNYLQAFGYDPQIKLEYQENNYPIYLKFSTEKKSANLSEYEGKYRGVLITIFTDLYPDIIGTYGHFPLNLFN